MTMRVLDIDTLGVILFSIVEQQKKLESEDIEIRHGDIIIRAYRQYPHYFRLEIVNTKKKDLSDYLYVEVEKEKSLQEG